MAFPSVRAVGAAQSGVGNVTPTLPTGTAANDILVLFIETGSADTVSTPTGYSIAGSSPQSDTTDATKLSIFWKRAASGEAAPTITDPGDHCVAQLIAIKDCVTSGDPFNATTGSIDTTSSTTTTLPAVTTTVDECLVLTACGVTRDSNQTAWFSGWTNSTLANLTEQMDVTRADGTGGGFGVASGELAAAGSSGTTSVTIGIAGRKTRWTGALQPTQPTVSQTAFRFYEDGTESGSTAIANQDTNINRDVSSGDSNLLLRIRLQNNQAVAQYTTDDYQLQYSQNGGSYKNVEAEHNTAMDSYAFSNNSGGTALLNTFRTQVAQSFTGNGSTVNNIQIPMYKTGSPTGNMVMYLYAHSGTFGSGGVPTGAALATSSSIAVSTIVSTDFNNPSTITFTFPTPYSTTSGTKYFWALEHTTGTSGNTVGVSNDPNAPTHGGNYAEYLSGTWTADNTIDCLFIVNTATASGVKPFASTNLTDGGATTNRLGAGTGSFVAGEISETGLITDHQLTASNFTEHVFSTTLVASVLANNDTLDFRVLKNGRTFGYTATPRITIVKSGTPPSVNTTNFFIFF